MPGLALKLLFGELAGALLSGQRVAPRKALEAGYRFRYPALDAALAAALA